MLDNQLRDTILKYFEKKANLTEFEQDILDSFNDLYKFPVDRNALIERIKTNKEKYKGLILDEFAVAFIETGGRPAYTPYEQTPDLSLQNSLATQIALLFSKIK